MNKKAQIGLGVAIIVAIMIFLVGMLNINFLKTEITSARSSAGLDCAGTISDGTKLTCLAVDLVMPFFIVAVFALAGGLITAKLFL